MGLRTKIAIAVFSLCFVVAGGSLRAADTESMSLDSLMNIPITAASKHEQSSLEAPASVTVISSDDIRAYGWRNLEDALNTVRGFFLMDDRNYSYLGVRGYQRPGDYSNRILLLLNGHGLNESTQGAPPINTLFALDLSLVDRIEIVRGPGSALYGTGAMFAVINIITKSTDTISGLRAGVSAATPRGAGFWLNYGANLPREWEIIFSAQADDQRGEDVYLSEYDDPETDNGIVKGLDWERRQGAFVGLRHRNLSINAFVMARWKGMPIPAWGITFNDSRAKTGDTHSGVHLDYKTEMSPKLGLHARANVNTFRYDGVYPYEPESYDNPEYMDERRAGIELRGDWNPQPNERLLFGVEYVSHFVNKYWSGTPEETYFDEEHPSDDLSLFAHNEYQLTTKTILTTGIRQTWYTAGWKGAVPRAALVYLPTRKSSLKLLYSEAFRTPTIIEAYYWYPDQTEPTEKLKPERIRALELSAEYRLYQELQGSISVFDFRVDDLINSVIDEFSGLTVSTNMGEAVGQGVEVELTYKTNTGPNGYISWAWQQAGETTDDQILSNSPRNLFRCGATAPLFWSLRGAFEVQADSKRYTLFHTKTGAYALLNVGLSTTPELGPLQATLFVRNAFDTYYKHPGGLEHLQPASSEDMLAIPQRGRTAGIRVEYGF